MKKSISIVAACLALLSGASASAGAIFTYAAQGVDFTFTEVDSDTFTLRMQNMPGATGDWGPATRIGALGFKGLGVTFGPSVSAMLTSNPAGPLGAWSSIKGELNGQGCSVNGTPDASICFASAPPLTLTNDMLFTVDITGASLSLNLTDPTKAPHLKLQLTEEEACKTTGQKTTCDYKKVGTLLSDEMKYQKPTDPSDPPVTVVPEPASLALVGLALAAVGVASRRRRTAV